MWSNKPISDRKARLPDDWNLKNGTRNRILKRDQHRCQWPMPNANATCGARASHVDHKQPGTTGTVPDHELWALCEPHHTAKTASEGGHATAHLRARTRLPTEPHPGRAPRPPGATPSPGS